LSHYGIKGQKWGIRRYQNPNGSLTLEGKERYRKTLDNAKRALADAHADHMEEAEGWERDLKDFRKTKPEKEEDWLQRNYGDSWKDSKWMKDVWEVDDVKKHAQEEIAKERKGYEASAKRHIEEARKEAELFEKRYLMLETKNFDDLSKKELKRLQKYLDYKGPWPFEDI
jgi:hypothetical protein